MKSLLFTTLAVLLAACSAPNTLAESPLVKRDTVFTVHERTLTDTLILGPEYGDTDTIVCPPGLVRDSLIYLYDYVYLPGRKVAYKVVVHDTVKVVEFLPQSPAKIFGPGYSWTERLGWLSIVITLIIGWLHGLKKGGKNAN
jgi:hypothetical protein